MSILEEMDRVFGLEIETLVKTRQRLDDSYAKATELLFHCAGKTVITGTGKSGLIAQKIAATMVSTGTPAVFLHPSDGMRGDVGIVQKDDVILAISKSGETSELLNILLFVKHLGVPVISITANDRSSLANSSDLVLVTPVTEEACPLNLAPTSSTTAALVLGDAIAMALMQLRGFEPDDFARLHPGGQLGKRLLLTIADIMRTGENNPLVNIKGSIWDMLYEITAKHSGAVSVVDDDGHLLGLVTDYDIRRVLEKGEDIYSLGISDIMNHHPSSMYSDAKAVQSLDLIQNRERPFLVLPVMDRGSETVVGMIHLHDLVTTGL